MPHKCLAGCGTWISDDGKYCVSCERTIYGEGGIVDYESKEEEAETGEPSHSVSQDT